MILNNIFQPALMFLRVIALCYVYISFVYERDKISRGTLRAQFSQVVFSISSRGENSVVISVPFARMRDNTKV